MLLKCREGVEQKVKDNTLHAGTTKILKACVEIRFTHL